MWTLKGKTSTGRKCIISAILLGSICIVSAAGFEHMKYNRLIDAIKEEYIGSKALEESELEAVLDKIAKKQKNKKSLSDKEYFILGYSACRQGDKALAAEYCKQVFAAHKLNADDSVKLYNGLVLVNLYLEEQKYEEAAQSMKFALERIGTAAFKRNYNEIMRFMNSIINIPGGKEAGIEMLEKVLNDKKGLPDGQFYDIKNKLGVLYLYNGNYAKGLERCLEVIAAKDSISNQYYVAKAYVDMGILYSNLGNEELARESIEKALEIELEDERANALSKAYALINLYSSIVNEGDYEELEESSRLVEEYSSLLSEEVLDSIQVISNTMLTGYYANKGNLEAAQETFEKLEALRQQMGNQAFSDMNLYYNNAMGEFLAAQGDLEGAIETYEKALEESMTKGNMGTAKRALTALISMLNDLGQYEKANVYEEKRLELMEREALLINTDYSEYALYKYEFEVEQLKMTNQKIKIYSLAFAGALIICIGAAISTMKYMTLKKLHKMDGLTKAYNRAYYEVCYKRLMESSKNFTIIMTDIDNFKSINDRQGHIFGDYVIWTVVNIMQAVLESQGKVFRYGGEEFVIVLEEKTGDEVVEISEKIRKAVENYAWEKGVKVTLSMGAAQSSHEVRDILLRADEKLYEAKKTGKNKVCL